MANSTIASLMVQLGLDAKGMEAGLKGVEGKLGGLKSSLSTGIGGAIATGFGGTALAGMTAFTAAAGAVTSAVAGTTVALGKMAINAAPIVGIKNSFDGLAKSAGTTGDAMLEAMIKGSSGMATSKDLMMSFNSAAQLVGIDFAKKLPDAMGYLGKVSAATGQDMGFMIDSLVKGVGRMSPMILDNLGIQVNLEMATARAAEMFGKEADELSKAELQAGMMDVTMEKLKENTAAMPDITNNASTKFAVFGTTLKNFGNEAGIAFLPAMEKIVSALQGLIENGAFTNIIAAIGIFAEAIAESVEKLQPFLDAVSDLGMVFGDTMKQLASGDIAGASKTFTAGIKKFTDTIVKMLPEIIRTGGTLLLGLVEGLVSAMPALAASAMTILPVLVTQIIAMLPEMLSLGLEIIVNLVNGLALALPTLIPATVEMLLTMIQTIIENAPMMIEAAINLILALVTGLTAAIPILLEQAPILIGSLIDAIIIALPMLFTAALEIILALTQAIFDNLPLLLAAGEMILIEVMTGIEKIVPQLAILAAELIAGFIEGITAQAEKFKESGAAIMAGLQEGVEAKAAELVAEIEAFGQDVLDRFKEIFGIASPSKVMQSIGEFLVTGLSKGIEALTGIADKITGAFSTAQTLLMPIITGIATFLQTTFTTALTGISNFFSLTLPLAITTLAGLFMNVLIPVLTTVGMFLATYMTPILLAFGALVNTSLIQTIMTLASQWRDYLYTAIKDTYTLLKTQLMVTIVAFVKQLLDDLGPAVMVVRGEIGGFASGLEAVRSNVTKLIADIKSLIYWLQQIKIPAQLTFNSPPPFAKGLAIISSNMRDLRTEARLFSRDIAGINPEINGNQAQPKYPTADEIGKAVAYALQQMGAV